MFLNNSKLTLEEAQRYSRHIFLPEIGGGGQQKIKQAKILVIGAGGLGSPVLSYLCAAGVGRLGIVEFDKVDISNLQRQIIHSTDKVAMSKIESATQYLTKLNPHSLIQQHHEKLSQQNAQDIFKSYEIIIDCCDNALTRYLIADTAHQLNKPCIIGAIDKYDGQLTTLKPFENNNPTYRDLFPYAPDNLNNCSNQGVLASLPGVIGALQATEALKLVTNIGEALIKKLLIYHGLTSSFHIINY